MISSFFEMIGGEGTLTNVDRKEFLPWFSALILAVNY